MKEFFKYTLATMLGIFIMSTFTMVMGLVMLFVVSLFVMVIALLPLPLTNITPLIWCDFK